MRARRGRGEGPSADAAARPELQHRVRRGLRLRVGAGLARHRVQEHRRLGARVELGVGAHGAVDAPAVDGVSLSLRQGELIALVGENGSGKTTLSALLTGLRVADAGGTVTWDGTDLAEADPHSVWSRVGLVPQDYTRWPMDLRANIHLGQPRTADDALLLDAAKAAGADSVIAKVPYGLDTLVASSNWGGTDLSGGQ
ncbi:ATP-binding cassette domain-containing protein [Streptomyces apocyni]|uniref:ATP-binding cassette domain-containing protein n=1 Tax=Streptomyces apocyni TaxID=2654677 RepID=UPI002D8090CE|nr:ATP-binding cassette domain-containing protein [Streptomyces apocyni]